MYGCASGAGVLQLATLALPLFSGSRYSGARLYPTAVWLPLFAIILFGVYLVPFCSILLAFSPCRIPLVLLPVDLPCQRHTSMSPMYSLADGWS